MLSGNAIRFLPGRSAVAQERGRGYHGPHGTRDRHRPAPPCPKDELSSILGRKVDLNTPGFLSRYFRDRVLAEAETQYVAA